MPSTKTTTVALNKLPWLSGAGLIDALKSDVSKNRLHVRYQFIVTSSYFANPILFAMFLTEYKEHFLSTYHLRLFHSIHLEVFQLFPYQVATFWVEDMSDEIDMQIMHAELFRKHQEQQQEPRTVLHLLKNDNAAKELICDETLDKTTSMSPVVADEYEQEATRTTLRKRRHVQ